MTTYSAESGDGTISNSGMTREQAVHRATEIANQTGVAATVQGDDGSEWDVEPSREVIRHGSFGPIVWSPNGTRIATQEDMNLLPVGADLTADEEAEIEE